MIWRDILWGIAAPAVLAGVFFFGAALFLKRLLKADAVFQSSSAVPLGLGLPVLLAFGMLIGWPDFPPRDTLQRFFYLVSATTLIGLLESVLSTRAIFRQMQALFFASGTLVPLMVLWSQLSFKSVEGSSTSSTQSWVWVFGVGLGIGVLTLLNDFLARKTPGVQYPFCWWLVTAGTAGALLISASAKGFQLAGALAAALGAAVIAGLIWKENFELSRGAARVFVFALTGLLLFGNQFAKLPTTSAILLAIAPLFAGVGELALLKACKPWQVTLIRLIACAVPVGIAVLLALKANPVEENPYA
jgi:hypothetical protein